MGNERIIVVSIKEESVMRELGAVFGQEFVRKVWGQRQSVVVCAYGPSDSGKTPLFEAAKFAALEQTPFCSSAFAPITEPMVKIRDFGQDTYPGPSYVFFPATGKKAPLGRPDLSRDFDMQINKLDAFRQAYLLEHPPVPSLKEADVLISISWPLKKSSSCSNASYFNDLAIDLSAGAEKLGKKEDGLIKQALDDLKAPEKDSACVYPFAPQDRIVRISSLSNDPIIEKAFSGMERVIKQKFPLFSRSYCP